MPLLEGLSIVPVSQFFIQSSDGYHASVSTPVGNDLVMASRADGLSKAALKARLIDAVPATQEVAVWAQTSIPFLTNLVTVWAIRSRIKDRGDENLTRTAGPVCRINLLPDFENPSMR